MSSTKEQWMAAVGMQTAQMMATAMGMNTLGTVGDKIEDDAGKFAVGILLTTDLETYERMTKAAHELAAKADGETP